MARLDRRALFTSGAAAALLAASGLAVGATPRPGGHLRLAVPRDGSLSRVARGAAFDQLTEIAPDGTLRGELAASWQATAGARRWQFRLRDNLRFHDGTPMQARHVADALRASGLPGLGDIRALGRHAVQIDLASANPDLPLILGQPEYAIGADCAVAVEGANGSGPYRIERMDKDRHLLARKVADHYRAGRAGWVDRIEVIVIPDPRIRAEALRDGYVDVASLPDPMGLLGRGAFFYRPSAENMALAAAPGVGVPPHISDRAPLDDGRIGERWWML